VRTWIACVLLVLGGACASMRKDTTVCPEYRSLRCATEPDCTMDSSRGCRVCRCSPADDLDVPPPEAARPPE
jgi:hypothetical protein